MQNLNQYIKGKPILIWIPITQQHTLIKYLCVFESIVFVKL